MAFVCCFELDKEVAEAGIVRAIVVVGGGQQVGDKHRGGLVRRKGGNQIAEVALLQPRDSPLVGHVLKMLYQEVIDQLIWAKRSH